MEIAKELGATHAINTKNQPDLGKAISDIVPSGVDYIIDSAGVAPLIGEAVKGMAIGGTLGLVAAPPSPDRKLEIPWFDTALRGQTVRGFTEGNSIPDIFIPQLIDL